jgi:uncharacterized protein YqcC (DUF446 family)
VAVNPQAAERHIEEIETELRRLKFWQDAPLPADRFIDMGAFGGRTMSYPQWLQFVFIPAAREMIAGRREWPTSSELGVQAVREFDSLPQAARLTGLLIAFDTEMEGGAPPAQANPSPPKPPRAEASSQRPAATALETPQERPSTTFIIIYTLCLSILSVFCFCVAADGIRSGSVMSPERNNLDTIARASHPFWFWVCEAVWAFGALASAFCISLARQPRVSKGKAPPLIEK